MRAIKLIRVFSIHYFSSLQNFIQIRRIFNLSQLLLFLAVSTMFNDAHHRKEPWKILSNILELEGYQWSLVIWGVPPMTSTDTRTEFYGKSDSMLFHILRGLDVTRVTQKRESLPAVGSLFVYWINMAPRCLNLDLVFIEMMKYQLLQFRFWIESIIFKLNIFLRTNNGK